MKFFYYCNRQLLTAMIAASIHLQKLPEERVPTIREILKISSDDRLISGNYGVPYFIGENINSQVYVINFYANVSLALQAIENVLSQRGVDFSKWIFLGVFESKGIHNIIFRMGERLSQKKSTSALGKYLAAMGIRKNYRKIIEMVNSSKGVE